MCRFAVGVSRCRREISHYRAITAQTDTKAAYLSTIDQTLVHQ